MTSVQSSQCVCALSSACLRTMNVSMVTKASVSLPNRLGIYTVFGFSYNISNVVLGSKSTSDYFLLSLWPLEWNGLCFALFTCEMRNSAHKQTAGFDIMVNCIFFCRYFFIKSYLLKPRLHWDIFTNNICWNALQTAKVLLLLFPNSRFLDNITCHIILRYMIIFL